MILLFQLLFGFSLLALVHSYILYPILMGWLGKQKLPNQICYKETDELPEIFIMMAAYNEEKVIAAKINSVFQTTYPLDKIKFYIGSDNSTDATNHIIQEACKQFPQIVFFDYKDRNGKSQILNRIKKYILGNNAAAATNAIAIMTDANVFFTKHTLFELAKHFKNEQIVQVSANIINHKVQNEGISTHEKKYISNEITLKNNEGLCWKTTQGAFGACYAIQFRDIPDIPPNFFMEDFYISMYLLSQKKGCIVNLDAAAYEDLPDSEQEEFKRKTRISIGNFQNLSVFWRVLFKFDATAFCFFSHKFLRWMGPFFILLIALSLIILVSSDLRYLFIAVPFLLVIFSPFLDKIINGNTNSVKILKLFAYFILMNIALLKGFILYIKGVESSVWKPTERTV